MNQSDADATTRSADTSAGASSPQQAQPATTARPRRRAPSRGRATKPAQAATEVTTANEAPSAAQAQPAPEAPQPQTSQREQPAQSAAAAPETPAADAAQARPAARPRRRGGRPHRGVDLVLPPQTEPALVEAAGAGAMPEATSSAAPETVGAEMRADEPAATTSAQLESAATTAEAHARPRYRFERRQPAAAAQQSLIAPRPERLSGRLAAQLAPGEAAAPTEAPVEVPAAAATLATMPLTPTPEARVAEATPAAEAAGEPVEAAVESEGEAHEGTTRRRRRRRRAGGGHAAEAETADTPLAALPEAEHEGENGLGAGYETALEETFVPYAPYAPGGARERGGRARPTARQPEVMEQPEHPEWDIANGQQLIAQPYSPFSAPEPAFARGFGPQPRGVAGPAREPYVRTGRTERGMDVPPISANQLGAIITSAIQQQTDRLLTELRRPVAPPSMTVSLPAQPSTERIGVFVDVANLLYSARNLRVSLDFGRMLEFLRGNRRLMRAHAYAPTDPDPNAAQTFLTAVKGVGYRITTKNYKTFASGAKKADLDLDMCMDIVRLVDAKAVETVVLVSGDSDFLPLLEYCSDKGVRVEVAAFEDSAAAILRQSCDLFINLSMVGELHL